MTLCFCTGSCAAAARTGGAAATGRRLLSTRKLLNNFLDFFHFWHKCWLWRIDYLIRFLSIFVVTLTLNFQGQIWNLLYLSPKWSDCHETKSKHIDWTLGHKCDHQVWPWQWPWSLNFQDQMLPRPLIIRMVLTKDFHDQILKQLYLRMGGPIDIEQRGWE